MKNLFLLFALSISLAASSQDSLRIMYYNLLNFPTSLPERTADYRLILQYAQPDVFVVNELDSEAGADSILINSLNVNGQTAYQRAAFIDGYDTDNGLFYNSDKLGLVDQLQIGTVLRDISVYQMYYKGPNLSAQSDTVYLWFFSCHLKAGQSDFEQRNQEALQVKYYLNGIAAKVENVFVGGDFNFYSGFESGCQTLLYQGAVPLMDPVNAIGNWSGDWSYADLHTQSTRSSGVGGGSGGGLDDRFDLILVSEDAFNNDNGVQYIPGTYLAMGQDGNHYNTDVNAGVNNSAPDSIIQALYSASDHLPVLMDVLLDESAGEPQYENRYCEVYFNALNHSLNIIGSQAIEEIVLFDLLGRKVFSATAPGDEIKIPHQLNGVFIWSIRMNGIQQSSKITLY